MELEDALYGLVVAVTWLVNEARHYLRWKMYERKTPTHIQEDKDDSA